MPHSGGERYTQAYEWEKNYFHRKKKEFVHNTPFFAVPTFDKKVKCVVCAGKECGGIKGGEKSYFFFIHEKQCCV
jgi:hypothetical protein